MPDDSEMCFEGDNLQNDIADIDLFNNALKTEKFWNLKNSLCPPDMTSTHLAVWLIIRMGASFAVGEKVMDHIRKSIGYKNISKENFTFKNETLKRWGLSAAKIEIIRNILEIPDDQINSKTLCTVKGGIAFIHAFKALSDEEDDCFMYEDVNIRRCLGVMLGRNSQVTESEARQLSKNWLGYRTKISQFLYRLKPESMIKILEEEELEEYDFRGKVRAG